MRLYIPGPVQVSEKTLSAMSRSMIGHRSREFISLYNSLQKPLQELFETKDAVFLSTNSAFGILEGSLRNIVNPEDGVLNCMNGAFSDKWHDVSLKCGKHESKALRFDWGQPVDPLVVEEELSTGKYKAVTIIHSETSTGCMSDLAAIMKVVKKFPSVISIVDVVSSFSALRIPKDELGIDVMIAGCQKAMAMPPGLTLFSVSSRVLDMCPSVKDRGYYFDFLEFHNQHKLGLTPTTPAISLIYALQSKLQDIAQEGIVARHERHAKLNQMVREYIQSRGFCLFPKEGYGSVTLNCFVNTLNIDLEKFNEILKDKHKLTIDIGYGKLKGKTFRISNMGDETEASITIMLAAFDDTLRNLRFL